MFPKQNIVALVHALQLASMPFSATIGLVIFGMLTAPPNQPKISKTVSEMLPAAESKVMHGKYDEALALYNKIIIKSPEPLIKISAYWGRGATRLKQFTLINTRVRTLRLKTRSDKSFTHEYQTTLKNAQTLFNQGVSDHLKAAKIALRYRLKNL